MEEIIQELPQELLKQLTPEIVHFMYTTHNWDTILLGDVAPIITVDQYDDLWVSYFDTWGIMGNPVKNKEDFNNRLELFKLTLGNFARQIYPFEKFLEEILKDNDAAKLGVEIASQSCEETLTEQTFVDFRIKLSEKQAAYRKIHGHPAGNKKKKI